MTMTNGEKSLRRMQGINPDSKAGIECTNCGCTEFRTRDTRKRFNGITRYRECCYCGKIIRTRETIG